MCFPEIVFPGNCVFRKSLYRFLPVKLIGLSKTKGKGDGIGCRIERGQWHISPPIACGKEGVLLLVIKG